MDPIGLVQQQPPPPLPVVVQDMLNQRKNCVLVTCKDLYHFKFSLAELCSVIVLFFVSLSNAISLKLVIDLSIVILVLSFILLLADIYHLAKRRDYRPINFGLFALECIVFITSAIVLSFWIDYRDNDNLDVNKMNSAELAVFYALDALMLLCSGLVVAGRVLLRAKDRQKEEIELGEAEFGNLEDVGIAV